MKKYLYTFFLWLASLCNPIVNVNYELLSDEDKAALDKMVLKYGTK